MALSGVGNDKSRHRNLLKVQRHSWWGHTCNYEHPGKMPDVISPEKWRRIGSGRTTTLNILEI
jgi:hypothetical protein